MFVNSGFVNAAGISPGESALVIDFLPVVKVTSAGAVGCKQQNIIEEYV